MLRFVAVVVFAACGSVENKTSDARGPDDAGSDTANARCDPSKPFGTPTLVANINTSNDETRFSTTRDERTGFVGYVVQSSSSATLLSTQRDMIGGEFGVPTAATTSAINTTAGDEYGPSPVADGLIVYFHRQTSTDIGIYAASRDTAGDNFSAGSAVNVDGSQLLSALTPTISADGQTLYWLDYQDFLLHAATRGSTPTIFTGNKIVSSIPIGSNVVLTADELTLYYSDGNSTDVLQTTRAAKSAMFDTGVPVANVNSPQSDSPAHLTYDGCVLYFVSTRPGGVGGPDIWEALRPL